MDFEINNQSPIPSTFEVPLERGRQEVHLDIALPMEDRGFEFINHSQFHRGPRNNGKGYKLVAWSFVAAMIDALLMIGVAIFFVLSAHFFTHMSLLDIKNLSLETPLMPIAFAAGFIFFYTSVQRVFMGHTIGEWACGLRLGQAKQRLAKYYGLRVCLRSVLVLSSGVILFPVLSAITGRDVLGRILRLPLIQLDPGLR